MPLRRKHWKVGTLITMLLVTSVVIALVARERCEMPTLIDRTSYNSSEKLRDLLGSPWKVERLQLSDDIGLARYGVPASNLRGIPRRDVVDIYVWRSRCPTFLERARVVAVIDTQTGRVLSLTVEDWWI